MRDTTPSTFTSVRREEEEGWGWGGGGGLGGHDKLCKLFWGVNIFSAPGMGRVSPKLVGQNKNAPALPPPPPLIFDRSLMCHQEILSHCFAKCVPLFISKNGTEAAHNIQFNCHSVNYSLRIIYFRISHYTLCLSPKFCINYCFQMLLGPLHIPKSI